MIAKQRPKNPDMKATILELPNDLKRRAKAAAALQDVSFKDWVIARITEGLDQIENGTNATTQAIAHQPRSRVL